ncbi:hypothetical protein VNO80_13622 [Phaseolus coccineus]|uniref:Uncharacterized protein n=1 Tax=Phaseolus coccineus TaxID=3886 RepID=A0AAN9RA33_PHACN
MVRKSIWEGCDWSQGDVEEPMREERVCSTPGKRGGYVASLQGAAHHNILVLDVLEKLGDVAYKLPAPVFYHFLPKKEQHCPKLASKNQLSTTFEDGLKVLNWLAKQTDFLL